MMVYMYATAPELEPESDVERPENYEKIRDICLVPLEDYNRITGDNIKLKSNEAIVSIYKAEYNEANIKLNLNGNPVNYNII